MAVEVVEELLMVEVDVALLFDTDFEGLVGTMDAMLGARFADWLVVVWVVRLWTQVGVMG